MFHLGILFKCGMINYMTGVTHGRHKKIISHRLDGEGGGEISCGEWQCRKNLLETLTLSRPDFLDTWRMKSRHKNVLFGVRNKKLRRLMTCNYVILPNGYHLGSAILDFWISQKN